LKTAKTDTESQNKTTVALEIARDVAITAEAFLAEEKLNLSTKENNLHQKLKKALQNGQDDQTKDIKDAKDALATAESEHTSLIAMRVSLIAAIVITTAEIVTAEEVAKTALVFASLELGLNPVADAALVAAAAAVAVAIALLKTKNGKLSRLHSDIEQAESDVEQAREDYRNAKGKAKRANEKIKELEDSIDSVRKAIEKNGKKLVAATVALGIAIDKHNTSVTDLAVLKQNLKSKTELYERRSEEVIASCGSLPTDLEQ